MSGRRGKEAEFLFDLVGTQCGWDIGVPITGDIESYDRIFRVPGKPWKTVQIKRVYLKKNTKHRTINLVRSNGETYLLMDCDYIAAVDMETRDVWLIPIHVLTGYSRKRITDDYEHWRITV